MKTKEQYMSLAIEEAKNVNKESVPIGCLIVDKKTGKIVASENNSSFQKNDPFSHAEIKALQKVASQQGSNYLNDFEIYVTLEPCLTCYSIIKTYRINSINFALRNFKYGFSNFLKDDKASKSIKINSGLYANESKELLRDFFSSLRNQKRNEKTNNGN